MDYLLHIWLIDLFVIPSGNACLMLAVFVERANTLSHVSTIYCLPNIPNTYVSANPLGWNMEMERLANLGTALSCLADISVSHMKAVSMHTICIFNLYCQPIYQYFLLKIRYWTCNRIGENITVFKNLWCRRVGACRWTRNLIISNKESSPLLTRNLLEPDRISFMSLQ